LTGSEILKANLRACCFDGEREPLQLNIEQAASGQ
jgi:hypothetical protein